MYCKWQRDPAGVTGPDLDPATALGSVPDQSQRIALYAHLADAAQTEGAIKCQWMALRKLELDQKEELASHTDHISTRSTPTHVHIHSL